ncbi:MAG: hypothetical protein QXR53_01240 [Candidatus Norongarragalinales archaeon]
MKIALLLLAVVTASFLSASAITISSLPYTIGTQGDWYNITGNLTHTTSSSTTPSITFNSSANSSGFTTDKPTYNITSTYTGTSGNPTVFSFQNGSKGGNNLTNVLAYITGFDSCASITTTYSNLTFYNVLFNGTLKKLTLTAQPDGACLQMSVNPSGAPLVVYFNNSIANITITGTSLVRAGFAQATKSNITVIVENSRIEYAASGDTDAIPVIFGFGDTASDTTGNYSLRVYNSKLIQRQGKTTTNYLIQMGNSLLTTVVFKNVIINQTNSTGDANGTVALINGTNFNFTNTTWQSDKFEFSTGNLSQSTVNRLWWVDVVVKYANGTAVEGANVVVIDNESHTHFSGTTNSTGYVQRQELRHYYLNGSETKVFTSYHNFTASVGSRWNQTQRNVTDNQVGSSEVTISINAPPEFQWQTSNFTNGSEFNTPLTMQFFVSLKDDSGISEVNMSFQNTNYTMSLWNGTSTSGVWNYNISGLPAGTYYYNFTALDGVGASTSQTYSIVVVKNTTGANLLLNSTDADLTIAYPQSVNASGFCSGIVIDTLYRNSTIRSNPEITTLAAGYYNYTIHCDANTNYSTSTDTHFLTVSKGSVSITATLDGSAEDRSYTSSVAVNASAWKNVTEGNLTLYRNGTSVDFDSSYVEESNQTPSALAETFNYTACFPEAQNYSATCTTLLANFQMTVVSGGSRGRDVYIDWRGAKTTPTPTITAPAPKVKEKTLDPRAKIKGEFFLSKTVFSLSYTAGSRGFKGTLAWTLPFDYSEYIAGKINISPKPSQTSEGSIIATWERLSLKPFEKFTVSVSLNEKTEEKILDEFTVLTLVDEEKPESNRIQPTQTLKPNENAIRIQTQNSSLIYALIIAVFVVALVAYSIGRRKNKGL